MASIQTAEPMPPDSQGDGGPRTNVTVKVLRALSLPKIDKKLGIRRREVYCSVSVGEKIRSTKALKAEETVVWGEGLRFLEVARSSAFKVEVFVHHRKRGHESLGHFEATMTSLTQGAGDGEPPILTRALVGSSSGAHILFQVSMDTPSRALQDATSAIKSAEGTVDSWSLLLSKLQIFMDVVTGISEVHPYAKMAWSILSVVPKRFQEQVKLDQDVKGLVETMASFFDIVDALRGDYADVLESKSGDAILARIAQQATECCYFIAEYGKTEGFALRTAKHLLSDTKTKVDGYKSALAKLKEEFRDRAATSTLVTVTRTMEIVQAVDDRILLNDMPYAAGAHYNPEKGCLAGTRTGILDEITDWINSGDPCRIFLLTGGAGTGKSAILHTIATRFDGLRRLGSSFCFLRGQEGRAPNRLFSTIARDLADKDNVFRVALLDVVRAETSVRTTLHPSLQYQNLCQALEGLVFSGPLVIVIDGLDESGDSRVRRDILQALFDRAESLPARIRIIIASRPENDIMSATQGKSHLRLHTMDGIPHTSTHDDILYYVSSLLQGRFSQIECKKLTEKSENIFQWAYVACEYICVDAPGSDDKERYSCVSFVCGSSPIRHASILANVRISRNVCTCRTDAFCAISFVCPAKRGTPRGPTPTGAPGTSCEVTIRPSKPVAPSSLILTHSLCISTHQKAFMAYCVLVKISSGGYGG